mgnify:CR=1 FL=1
MKKKINLLLMMCIIMLINVHIYAQDVVISVDDSTPDNSVTLDIKSTNSGLLIPRVPLTSGTDTTTISSPATSLMVYNTNTDGTAPNNVYPGYYYNQGTTTAPKWVRLETNTDNGGGGPTGCASCISMVSEVSTNSMTWGDCASFCRSKTDGGFTDWRIPTFEEVIYYTSGASNITFTTISNYIWTSTPYDAKVNPTTTACNGDWVIFREFSGNWSHDDYNHHYYCRCVR